MTSQTALKDISGRQHDRTKMRARLKLMHPAIGELSVFTSNLSDGGLFVHHGGQALPAVGETVKIQVQDMPIPAPLLSAKIVRCNEEGVGMMFLDEEEG